MAHSLPVPSKGALRALRHLALATSCTVAFGAGLITADRHRRIQKVHQVCENARRIKTSRRYHSAGTTVATSFEEQIQNYCENGPWRGSEKEQLLDRQWNGATADPDPQPLGSQKEPERTSKSVHGPKSISAQAKVPTNLTPYNVGGKLRYLTKPEVLTPTGSQLYNESVIEVSAVSFSRQERLAREVIHYLQDESDDDMLSKAAATLSQAFADGLQIHNLENPLLKACVLFSQTCERLGCFKFYVPALKTILTYGRVNEEIFSELLATAAIAQLLEESGYLKEGSGLACLNPEKLHDAATIFCTKLRTPPVLILSTMLEIGTKLLTATIKAKLYDLSERILRCVNLIGGNVSSSEVEIVILAGRARLDNDQVLHHFFRLFSQTRPDQISFYSVVRAALETALDVKRLDKAEEVFLVASQMAKVGGLLMPKTWMLQILGQHWRATRNLASTQALFGRLEPAIQNTRQPEAVYNAMSQFCIEAGNESELQKYLDRLEKTCPSISIRVQTYGNLALASAVKGDWKGVEDNFKSIKSLSPGPLKQAALFAPVLKRFAASHAPAEVETFLRFYIERLDLIPNQYISNIMIGAYCKAKEIDFVARWIHYGQTIGLQIDAVGFNIILCNCQAKWAMRFDDLYRLCAEVMVKNDKLIDDKTIRILRRAVFSSAGGNPDLKAELLSKVASLQQSTGCCLPDDIETIMGDALADGKPAKAIEAYEDGVGDIVPINPRVAALAVRASVTTNAEGDLNHAIELISQARALNTDVGPAIAQLLVHSMENASKNDLRSMAVRTLASLENGGFEITLAVATKVISLLVDKGFKKAAIELWTSLSTRYEKMLDSIDIVLLTVLLKAYLQLFDRHGIRWVMGVLSLKNIKPDKRFKMTLKNARMQARKRLQVVWTSNVEIHLSFLDDCVRRVSDINKHDRASQKDVGSKISKILKIRTLKP